MNQLPNHNQDPSLQRPDLASILEQAGVNPNALNTNVELRQADPHDALVIDVTKLNDINPDDKDLKALIDVGGTTVKLYAGIDGDKDYMMLAAATYDSKNADSHERQVIDMVPLAANTSFDLGREQKGASRLGLKDKPHVSRNHVAVWNKGNGILMVADKNSTNGTNLVFEKLTGESEPVRKWSETIVAARKLGATATKRATE